MKKPFVMLAMLLATQTLTAQTFVWEGAVDTDFYNEQNWIIEGTSDNPSEGVIDAGVAIAANLKIADVSFVLSANDLAFSSSDKGLFMSDAVLEINSITEGFVDLEGKSTLVLNAEAPLGENVIIDLADNYSWVKFINVDPESVETTELNKIKSDNQALTLDQDVSIDMYYYGGSLVRRKDDSFHALMLFDGTGQTGDSFGVGVSTIYSDEELGDFDNKASSFRLERGFVATMAIFQNGTGKSEVFIASEETLEINLPEALSNTVSFIRVMPWNWVTKKGASKFIQIGTTWTYNWNRNSESLPALEYAPMAWGYGAAQLGVLPEYIEKEGVTHVMGFNESDNCNDQSGQYNNLCQIEVAVPTFKNLMRTGLRLVSPSPRENGPLPGKWLSQFRDLAVETDVRYDVLGVHWYDWANNPQNSPFADPQEVFDRFKNYLDRVYEEHGMPIWITEFNANANRDVSVHLGFLELALPYLESLHFVERYDYFEPNPDIANNREDITFAAFYDEDGAITPLGIFYRDFESTPSIPEETWSGSAMLSGLEGKVNLTMEVDKSELNEGEALTISFSTDRSVGAAESFDIEVDLGEEQYTLTADRIELREGGSSAEVSLVAVDDDLVEDVMTGSVSLTNLSDGIEWNGDPVTFSLISEDEEIVIPLSVDDHSILTLFPNPTNRFIQFESGTRINSVSVFSLDGKEQPEIRYVDGILDLGALESGVYFINALLENGQLRSSMVRKN